MKAKRLNLEEVPSDFYKVMKGIEHYLNECGISTSIIELIKTRASQLNGCGFCLDMHHKDAIKAGESFERLYLLPSWHESPCYTKAEKAVLNLTDMLTKLYETKPKAIEEAYDQMAEYFSKEEIANVVLCICQINSWNRIAITFGNVPGSYSPD